MNYPIITHATYKNTPSDFVVTEILPFADAGELASAGEHLWLYIKKIGMNTAHLVKLLAMWAKIPVRDVGYSGLKDRHAETYQWFSLRLPTGLAGVPDLTDADQLMANFSDFMQLRLAEGESVQLLRSAQHHKKLNRGTHKQNHFNIVVRDIKQGDSLVDQSALNQQLAGIAKTGIPNFFGSQRFGRDAGNVDKATAYLKKIIENPKHRHRDRDFHSLMVSVARSAIFNEILARRVADNTWCTAIAGDVFNLNGTGSVFHDTIDEVIVSRIATGDIHPTGLLYGSADKLCVTDAAAAIEQAVISEAKFMTLTQGLDVLGIKAGRRSLRLLIDDLSWQWQPPDVLNLSFSLPTGAYATSVLAELVNDLVDGSL